MSDIAIVAQGLGKQYRIGQWERETALRNVIGPILRAPWKLWKREKKGTFWALKDVDLEVKHGEVLGLIGRNGAGKTTLLKLLSRITKPTKGWAEIYGRVGSLLEVGTGFHPELSGRDNIYLSGAILGMSKREIASKFDEIVAFAEIEKFIGVQVKHYSSGMYVRLAFAVAAHLEPEILIVDEVLAVGDITFQKKCLGKMEDVARQGRTVLLVSHNMAAINALASRVLVMKDGQVAFEGSAGEATARYYAESLGNEPGEGRLEGRRREGNGKARFASILLQPFTAAGGPVEIAYPGCDLRIEFELECLSTLVESNAAVIIYDRNGVRVIDVNTAQKGHYVRMNAGEKARISFLLHDLLLKPGQYFLALWLGRQEMEVIDHVEHAATLHVMEGENNSEHPITYPGVYLCRFEEEVSIFQASAIESAHS